MNLDTRPASRTLQMRRRSLARGTARQWPVLSLAGKRAIASRDGLSPKDQVVLHPSNALADGEEVTVTSAATTPAQH